MRDFLHCPDINHTVSKIDKGIWILIEIIKPPLYAVGFNNQIVNLTDGLTFLKFGIQVALNERFQLSPRKIRLIKTISIDVGTTTHEIGRASCRERV